MFHLADNDIISIIILDYVLDEMKHIFLKKKIEFKLILDLMETYENIAIDNLDNFTHKEIELARKLINDPEDRPIFIYAHRLINRDRNAFLISGDMGFFKEAVKKALNDRILRTKEFLDLILNNND